MPQNYHEFQENQTEQESFDKTVADGNFMSALSPNDRLLSNPLTRSIKAKFGYTKRL